MDALQFTEHLSSFKKNKWKTNRYAKIFNESGDFVVVSFMFWLKINGDVD